MTERNHVMSDDCWCRPCKVRYDKDGQMVDVCHRDDCDCDL